MVNRTAGLGGDLFTNEGSRRYPKPWSRGRSLVFLVAMLFVSGLLAVGGIHIIRLTIVWR